MYLSTCTCTVCSIAIVAADNTVQYSTCKSKAALAYMYMYPNANTCALSDVASTTRQGKGDPRRDASQLLDLGTGSSSSSSSSSHITRFRLASQPGAEYLGCSLNLCVCVCGHT